MNRIERIFADLRAGQCKALMPYVTAGDPDLATTAALLPALQEAGASVCELGIAFSDPIADGQVIQDAMRHALSQGLRPRDVLRTVAELRSQLSLGLVAMVSYSIVHRLGDGSFAKDAAEAGFDGLIIPDLPIDEAERTRDIVADAGLTCSFLIAPTTPTQRAQRIAKACTGFVYLLARAGLTGERSELPEDLPANIARIREVCDLPIAVGFGISTAEHVRQVVGVADAAIVGSAIVRRISKHRDGDASGAVADVRNFVQELATGLPQTAGASG